MTQVTEKKENRGGARPGSGPKRSKVAFRTSDSFREALELACETRAKAEGRTVADILIDICYDAGKREQLQALKIVFDKLITTASEAEVASGPKEPGVYLPEMLPDPAKVVSIK